MKKGTLLLLLIIPFLGIAQTEEERIEIASKSDKIANEKLAEELKIEDNQRQIRLLSFLKNNPNANRIVYNDNRGRKEIMDVLPSGEIIFAQTDNNGAAITARANRLYSGGSLGINIQGQGMTPAVWDGGNARESHQEFMVSGVSKVQLMDGATYDDHATHVIGTIAAQGIVSNARGVAFNSSVKSYDWTGDLSEMITEASTGLLTSNHSYGIGSLGSIWFYGAYDSRARQMDNICFNNPFYLPVVSAGNDRGSTEVPGSTQNANKGGYDLIFGHANAKNVLTVAAVNQVSTYTDPTSVVMSSFSSWGPSDDGRIKPEISMKGVNVRSTLDDSDSAYGFMSGTSMASPGVTGVVTLLQQYYNQLYGNFMRSATVKGLIMHTADEAGLYDGPDYEFGWGLINAENAAKAIRDKNLTSNASFIQELNLLSGSNYTKVLSASGTQPLKVSISWTDPQATSSNNGTTDPTTKYLVNDLDVKVVSSDGTTYYPWKLQGMAAPYDTPTNLGTNDVDNFERIDIPNPSGVYTITVTHKGALFSGNQNFSIIATSGNLTTLNTHDLKNVKGQQTLYPNPAKDYLFSEQFSISGKYSILDGSGRILKSSILTDTKIDVRNLMKGNYLLVYTDREGNIFSSNFIKE